MAQRWLWISHSASLITWLCLRVKYLWISINLSVTVLFTSNCHNHLRPYPHSMATDKLLNIVIYILYKIIIIISNKNYNKTKKLGSIFYNFHKTMFIHLIRNRRVSFNSNRLQLMSLYHYFNIFVIDCYFM